MEKSVITFLDKLWDKLQDLESDINIVNYWDKRQSKIVTDLKKAESNCRINNSSTNNTPIV